MHVAFWKMLTLLGQKADQCSLGPEDGIDYKRILDINRTILNPDVGYVTIRTDQNT